MRNEKVYGAALIASAIVLLTMSVTHPTHIPDDSREALERLVLKAGFAHGLAIAGVWLSLWGLAGFSRLLGLDRPIVLGALTAFALPAAGVVVAAALDGFVTPQLALQLPDADAVRQASLHDTIRFCVLVASALTRIYLIAGAAAIVLWSVEALRLGWSRTLVGVGGVVALAGVALCFGGPRMITVHELLLLVLGQGVWMTWVGVLLWRRGVSPRAA